MITIGEQIACVKREIGLRRRLYPRFVKGGRFTQEFADDEIANMEAVLATLKNVAAEQEAKVNPPLL